MDELLPYYNRELEFLRRQAGEFAAAYPKIAGRLRLSGETIEDPHVARLIESVALLNARIRLKLDDDFPELTEAILGVLYPHYLAPVPAMGLAQFVASAELKEPYTVPRGTEIDTEPVDGQSCRFRTTQDVTLWPVEVAAATLAGRPFRAPRNPAASGALAVLHLKLRCRGDASFAQVHPNTLRFYLAGGTTRVLPLYEAILNRTIAVAVANGAGDPAPVMLPAEAVRPVGFGREEGMLPYPARSFVGYRLLTEYFAFPEKFLFFEVAGLATRTMRGDIDKELDLFFYLSETDKDLERGTSAELFQLGCAPIVNLFRQRAEPIKLGGTAYEYRVIADSRRPDALEIHSIESVTATAPDGEEHDFLPFHGLRHHGEDGARYYQAMRRAAANPRDRGSELFLTLVDRDLAATAPANWVLSVQTLCGNRDLPARLPFGGGHPYLSMISPTPAIREVRPVTALTPTRRPAMGRGRMWRILSHLSLNHLSIVGGADAAEALREILRIYDYVDTPESRAAIDSIMAVSSKRGLARVAAGDSSTLAHGLDVALTLDPRRFPAGGMLLFASVLERFLGLYAAVNAFSRVTLKAEGRSAVVRSWPPRAGEKILL
ncbi:MAG: type VI secretion system baseplate subunit TssF [Alphaproteobacteria bacterium]|nr:type VI secretion system baseplate subunit TssF [Alphaproteobacteria bacterium]